MNFEWHLSYQDECEYKVYGSPHGLKTIETYRANEHMLNYLASVFNGSPEQFKAEIVARQGGCVVRYREHETGFPYRWHEEEYLAFLDWLITRAKQDEETIECYRRKYPDVNFDGPKFVAPVPMYYDIEAHTFKTEPFYKPTPKETTL